MSHPTFRLLPILPALVAVPLVAQQPPRSLAVSLQPLENPDHVNGVVGGRAEDLSLLLRENHITEAAETSQGPKLTLQPRISRLPHGIYAYSVTGFVQVPDAPGALRVFTATAVRDVDQVDAGLRQAVADAAAAIVARIEKMPADAPMKRLLIAGAPPQAGSAELVDLDRIKARITPLPPLLSSFARARNISGVTRTRLVVNEDGAVTRADLLQGPPELSLIALFDAMERSFVPLPQQGLSAPLKTEVSLVFSPHTGSPNLGLPSSEAPKELAMYSHNTM